MIGRSGPFSSGAAARSALPYEPSPLLCLDAHVLGPRLIRGRPGAGACDLVFPGVELAPAQLHDQRRQQGPAHDQHDEHEQEQEHASD
jgi:hypothetical protein